MAELGLGERAVDFNLAGVGADGQEVSVSLSDLRGKNVVLYFYPKDATTGCTRQACDFRDNMAQFNGLNAVVLGVSGDSVASHMRFIQKQGLDFTLLSDVNKLVCEAYGVWVEKSLYGRKYMGIERTSFLIDKEGVIAGVWRKVKVAGHVQAVLEALKRL